ncbi:NUDIX domain-containing protein [Roseibium aestuarii]|uniref:NUDIX domain-containing protein n=1 Tax=Roseibium aestuarii TaxID=2600299 RepID=A0ABW4JYN4_9HYPH
MGVRVMVVDRDAGTIHLVRHTYLSGWYLPGGGVDPGERLDEAARREVREELGVEAFGAMRLIGFHLNRKGLGRDQVGLFLLTDWAPGAGYLVPNGEIAEAGVFPMTDLPEDVTRATRARIEAYLAAPDGAALEDGAALGYWDQD